MCTGAANCFPVFVLSEAYFGVYKLDGDTGEQKWDWKGGAGVHTYSSGRLLDKSHSSGGGVFEPLC